MIKQIGNLNTYVGLRLMLAICAIMTFVPNVAMAQDLFTDAEAEITANKTKLISLLGIVFLVTLAFVAFKLVRRGTNKV
jgi:uncharacterized membrane protein